MKLIYSQDVINLIEKSQINGWIKDALIDDIKVLPDLGNCKNCKIMEYVFMQVTDAKLQPAQPDCTDCKKHGGDWECDHMHCRKGRLPSVQSEIIRCKDCKHYDGRPCGIVDWYNTADDFCSKAERRVDENNNSI